MLLEISAENDYSCQRSFFFNPPNSIALCIALNAGFPYQYPYTKSAYFRSPQPVFTFLADNSEPHSVGNAVQFFDVLLRTSVNFIHV